MSTLEASTPEQVPVSMDGLLRENLKIVTEYASGGGNHDPSHSPSDPDFWDDALVLKSPDGVPVKELKGECEDENRAMLDKLYELSHADLGQAVTEQVPHIYLYNPDRTSYVTHRVIPTKHGFYFCESYAYDSHFPINSHPFTLGIDQSFIVRFMDEIPAALSIDNQQKLAALSN